MRRALVSIVVVCSALCGSAFGATLEIAGDSGSVGAAGLAGQDGGDGGAGAPVDLTLEVADEDAFGSAFGGAGGAGGVGGSAALPGDASGSGGDGGSGGAATAFVAIESVLADFFRARAEARGGAGGTGAAAGAPGGVDGVGGAGGTALATARSDTSLAPDSFGSAKGGDGGAGREGGVGGNAHADAHAASAEQTSRANAFASGGAGGSSLAPGGARAAGGRATASATAVAAGGGSASASTSAFGGSGGTGGDAVLRDSVSGSTGPDAALSLSQFAVGGVGDQQGGDAVSELIAENPGGGAILIRSYAAGGAASAPTGGRGGRARVSAVAFDRSGSEVTVFADAIQSRAGADASALPGEVSLGRIYGASVAGGDVSVFAAVEAEAPDLVDVVDGDTTGELFLRQDARASAPRIGVPMSARSVLSKTSDARTLELESTAVCTGSRADLEGDAPGGFAQAISSAVGSGLSVRSTGASVGGAAGSGTDTAAGGDAESIASAHSTGDALGTAAFADARGGEAGAQARGGRATSRSHAVADGGGPVDATSIAAGAQAAGDARAESLAIGAGLARIASTALAFGGLCNAAGCGAANALAEARGAGIATSVATASGRGGLGATALAASDSVVRRTRASQTSVDIQRDFDYGASWSAIHAPWEGSANPRSDQNLSVALGHPVPSDVDAWLDDGSQAAAIVQSGGEVLALGILGAGADGSDFSGELSFSLERSAVGDGNRLFLAFLAPEAIAGGFESLDLSVRIDGADLLDLQWSDLGSADTFFGESVLELPLGPPGSEPILDVLITLGVVLGDLDQEIFASFALFSADPVPEPALGALVLASLLALVLRRRIRPFTLER